MGDSPPVMRLPNVGRHVKGGVFLGVELDPFGVGDCSVTDVFHFGGLSLIVLSYLSVPGFLDENDVKRVCDGFIQKSMLDCVGFHDVLGNYIEHKRGYMSVYDRVRGT